MFVRGLGGYVGLDVGWQERAWAEFCRDRDGGLSVVCRLDKDGDLDVTVRPVLEGDNIRKHACLPQALAAFAYLNPASSGDGERVSRDDHHGDWYQLSEDLAVAVAVNGKVGATKVDGRGAFLVHKGRLWLPHGHQTPGDVEHDAAPVAAEEPQISASRLDPSISVQGTPVAATGGATNGERPVTGAAEAVASVSPLRTRPPSCSQPRQERYSRVFGDAADELINQARSAGRGRG